MNDKNMKSQFGLTGNVSLYELPPDYTYLKFKELEEKKNYLIDNGSNLVVNVGLQQTLDLMLGVDTSSFTYCGVGTGTTAAAATDTAEETITGARMLVTDRWRGGTTGYWSTFFGKNDNNATWTETTISNALTAGDMLARRKFASSFAKSTSNAAVVEWSITLTGTADS